MDTKQLLTMITLSQTLNYQKAAEQLQYAPSTLFKHIQMLEQEVGAPLFRKTGRQMALTPQGEAFLVHANRMVEHYYLALDSVCPAEKLEGSITVGGCEINIGNSLIPLFEQFHTGARGNAAEHDDDAQRGRSGADPVGYAGYRLLLYDAPRRGQRAEGRAAVSRAGVYDGLVGHPAGAEEGAEIRRAGGHAVHVSARYLLLCQRISADAGENGRAFGEDDVFGRRAAGRGAGAQRGRDDARAALCRAALSRRLRLVKHDMTRTLWHGRTWSIKL